MAAINPPGWLQNAGATHTAAQLRSYHGILAGGARAANALIPKSGVNPNLGFQLQVTQTGSPSMAVLVRSGLAIIAGTENANQGAYVVMNDADVTVSITAAHATLNRIDIIVFKVQDSIYSGGADTSSIVVVDGTPAGSPAPPTAPANSITLAEVLVVANDTSITNSEITDKRAWLTSLSGSKLPDVQVFTSSGTWTKPTGALNVHVRVQAGGGGGGAADATGASQWAFGDGGGGGEYAEGWYDASALAATVTVTVGTGGAAGTGGGAGGAGNTSSFGATITCTGGGGGSARPVGTGNYSQNTQTRAGGTGGTGGSIRIAGSPGGMGVGIASTTSGVRAGDGGGSVLGASVVEQLNNPGNTGKLYGGGGGGAANSASQAARNGGAGAAGVVIVVTYF